MDELIGTLIIPNTVFVIPLNINSLLFVINNELWYRRPIFLLYEEAKKYFHIVYSGGHHRQWCGQGWHFQQTVLHKGLPKNYYKSFRVYSFNICDCATWVTGCRCK